MPVFAYEQQAAVMFELKNKQHQVRDKKVMNREDVYHGALEDILSSTYHAYTVHACKWCLCTTANSSVVIICYVLLQIWRQNRTEEQMAWDAVSGVTLPLTLARVKAAVPSNRVVSLSYHSTCTAMTFTSRVHCTLLFAFRPQVVFRSPSNAVGGRS